MKAIAWVLIPAGLLGACTEKYHFRTEDPTVVKVDEMPQDFKMPAAIWDLVDGGSKGPSAGSEKPASGEATSGGGKAVGSSQAAIVYSTATVYLTEKNQHILKAPSYKIEFPKGGGKIDLAQYRTGDSGSFFVGFDLPEELIAGDSFKVFYVGGGRKRRIDDRVFGSGCNEFMDITDKFLQMMKTEGLRVNTTRQRDTTVLAGHYIFAMSKDNQIYISQVTITDSQNKTLLCEGT